MKMRKVLLLFVLLLGMTATVNAQQLTVDYQAKLDSSSLTFLSEMGVPAEMRGMIASAFKDFTMKFQLRYKDGESSFDNIPMDKPQTINIMGQTIDGKTIEDQYKGNSGYKNRKKNLAIQQVNFMGKKILVKGTLDSDTFEVVNGAKKEILGYECKEAVSKDKKKTVWFTDYIPVADGPVIGAGITGLVLEASDGNNIFTATKISDTVSGTFAEPTEGQVMSEQEFKDYVKKTADMLKMGPGM